MSIQHTESENWANVQELLRQPWSLLSAGELVGSVSGRTFDVASTLTESVIATVPDAGAEDAVLAVTAAERAFPEWAATQASERAEIVRRIADVLDENAYELALLDAIDGGAPLSLGLSDVQGAASRIRYFAGLALEQKGFSSPSSGNVHFTIRQPYGVVLRITPFNHPILFAAWKLAVPLIAGNCVVLKPADSTPLSALYLGSLVRDILPAGVASILVGSGPTLPQALVRHPAIRRIGFIGSEPVGRAIMRDAAETGVKKVTLELGGKNALIAFPDADPEAVARGAVNGMNFTWSGQSCGSTSRLIVHEAIASAVVDHVVKLIQDRRIGSPLDPASEQGTIVTAAHHAKILAMVATAVASGARLVTGGGRPAHLATGLYIEPVVLDDVTPDLAIARDEVFGPVLSVIRFGDADDPIAIANSVAYGLTGSVFTNDVTRAHRVARALECGYVWVNGAGPHFPGMPFGGWKASGIGREGGLEELLDYTQEKAIHIML